MSPEQRALLGSVRARFGDLQLSNGHPVLDDDEEEDPQS